MKVLVSILPGYVRSSESRSTPGIPEAMASTTFFDVFVGEKETPQILLIFIHTSPIMGFKKDTLN